MANDTEPASHSTTSESLKLAPDGGSATPTSRADDSAAETITVLPDPTQLESQPPPPGPAPENVVSSFGPRPACFPTTLAEIAFVFQATMATATNSFFQGASAIITASIGHDLGMSQGQITWITASTALTAGAFQLGLGQLADLMGRKLMFVMGMASFSVFALLVGFAKNPFWMDVVCGILGVSSAMVVPPAIGIMGAAYSVPSKRKNLAFSAFSAGNPLGFVFGSIISGVATMLFNWRASYYLIAILWVVFAALAAWTVPKVEAYPEGQGVGERVRTFVRTFDFVGTTLTIFGAGILTAGIT